MPRRLAALAWTIGLLVALAVAGVLGLASHGASRRPAPALPRESLSGRALTLGNLLAGAGGRPAVVVFWASWCGPCAQEAPALERFATSAAGRGRLVGVDWSDPSLSEARTFVRRHRWSFPNLRDADGVVGNSYHVPVLPTSFIIDAHRRIRATLPGPQSQRSLQAALASVEHS